MSHELRFCRRPLARACGWLLFLSGVAHAQVPAAPGDAAETPAASPAAPEGGPTRLLADLEQPRPLPSAALAGYTLERCIQLTLKNYPKIHEARARLSYRREQQVQSWSQPYSEFNVTGGLALVPEVRGTPVYSPDSDVAISSKMGLAWQIGIEGAIPLWTFGKITSLWDASAAAVKLAQQDVEKEKNAIKLDVRRAYYGGNLT